MMKAFMGLENYIEYAMKDILKKPETLG